MNAMKKRFIIFAAVFVMVFQGCGESQKPQEDAKKAATEQTEMTTEMEMSASEEYQSENNFLGSLEIKDEEGNIWITTDDLVSVAIPDENAEPCIIEMVLSEEGAKKFADATMANIGKKLPIYVNGECVSSPVVNEAITYGKLQISGFSSFSEANEIVNAIKNVEYKEVLASQDSLMEETESNMQQEPIVEETETQEEVSHRDGMYGISDKKISALDSSFSVSDVRNDVTGKLRISVVAENMQMVEYALNYYNRYIHNNEEVHGIVNFNNYTTTYISSLGMDDRLFVTVHEYVDGEEHDANLLFSGMVLEDYIVYTDNGDIEKIQ